MFERRMYGLSAKTVVHTPFAQEKLQQQGFKNQQGFEVAGMGVDVNVFSPKERLAPQDFFQTFANKIDKPVKHPDWKIITTVSRISPEKELDKLLNLAPKLAERQLNLVIAGDGPQLKALKAKYNHLDNVIFLGHVQHGPELAKVYASADIFVAPSTCDEGGCTSFESVACGTPAIVPGPNIQGPSQLLLPSENALFFSPASKPAQTEQAILDTIDDMLAQQNQGEFQRVSVSKTAQEHYSWESFTDHLLAGLVPIDSSVWNEKKR